MVLRHAVLAVLMGAIACGNGTDGLVIQLEVDDASCGSSGELLTLACGATVWVGVSDDRDELVAHACTTLSEGNNLATLGPRLTSSIDLGALPGSEPLTLRVWVYPSEGASCPVEPQSVSSFVSGALGPLVLGDQDGSVTLTLRCATAAAMSTAPTHGPQATACMDDCATALSSCLANNGIGGCANAENACVNQCGGTCGYECGFADTGCVDDVTGPVLDCAGARQACLDDCGTAGMDCNLCDDLLTYCQGVEANVTSCRDDYSTCISACDPSECLVAPAR